MQSLTNIKNLDLEILTWIDNRDYDQVRLVNSYFNNLCVGDELWKRKLSKKLTNRLIYFKLECMTWPEYYFMVSQHYITFVWLVVCFGDKQLIDDVSLGLSNPNMDDVIKYLKSDAGNKQAIKHIVDVIRRYPDRQLNLEETTVLRYALFYGELQKYHDGEDYGYPLDAEATNEVDWAFVFDKENYTFSWMLQQGLKFNWKFITEVDAEGILHDKVKTLITHKIPIPSGIFFAAGHDDHKIIFKAETLELLFQHGYIADQDEIDFSLSDHIISWISFGNQNIEVQKTYIKHGYFVSQEAFDKFVTNWISYSNMFTIIDLYSQYKIYPSPTVPKRILKSIYKQSITGFQKLTGRFSGLINLLEWYQNSNIKINYQDLVNTAKKYNVGAIVDYITNKFNVYPDKKN